MNNNRSPRPAGAAPGLPGVLRTFFRKNSVREAAWGYLFLSPWFLGLIMFTLGPIILAFTWSFTHYQILGSPDYIGFENFNKILVDPNVIKSLENTAYFVLIRVPIYLVLAFILALLLNRAGRLIPFFRAALYLPAMAPVAAMAVLWQNILSPQSGYVNYYMSLLHIPAINFLNSQVWVKPAIVGISMWTVGVPTMIFLAGLQSVPEHLYESADIDGANAWNKLLAITIPMMTPTILLNLIIEMINSFQVFAYAFIVTRGGPADASLFYVLYIYRYAFEFFQMGYASALSVILFLIILVLTALVMFFSNKWVTYERI
jgi:multiple sugar transport system permease protein